MFPVFFELLKSGSRITYWLAVIGTVVMAVTDIVLQAVQRVTTYAVDAVVLLSGANLETTMTEYAGVVGLANHFFPLSEMWALMLFTVPYMLAVVTLRFVKQFIPTVSN